MSWSSVTAFVAAAQTGSDPRAQALLVAITSELADDERLVVDAQQEPSGRRVQWLETRTGRRWTPAQLAHVEGLAFVAIRRELQRQGLFASDLRSAAAPR